MRIPASSRLLRIGQSKSLCRVSDETGPPLKMPRIGNSDVIDLTSDDDNSPRSHTNSPTRLAQVHYLNTSTSNQSCGTKLSGAAPHSFSQGCLESEVKNSSGEALESETSTSGECGSPVLFDPLNTEDGIPSKCSLPELTGLGKPLSTLLSPVDNVEKAPDPGSDDSENTSYSHQDPAPGFSSTAPASSTGDFVLGDREKPLVKSGATRAVTASSSLDCSQEDVARLPRMAQQRESKPLFQRHNSEPAVEDSSERDSGRPHNGEINNVKSNMGLKSEDHHYEHVSTPIIGSQKDEHRSEEPPPSLSVLEINEEFKQHKRCLLGRGFSLDGWLWVHPATGQEPVAQTRSQICRSFETVKDSLLSFLDHHVIQTKYRGPTPREINECIKAASRGASHLVRGGKWMIQFQGDTSDVIDVWGRVFAGVWTGYLGTDTAKIGCSTAVMSTGGVICIYTSDAFDEADVLRVLTRLRKIGITHPLNYKMDLLTYFNWYYSTVSPFPVSLWVAAKESTVVSCTKSFDKRVSKKVLEKLIINLKATHNPFVE
eukprot:Rmarinus@m.11254